MAKSGFMYRRGPQQFKNKGSTASTAIAVGDALKTVSGLVLPLTTDTKCDGVAMAAKAVGDAATTKIQIMQVITGRTVFFAWSKAGTALASTNEEQMIDVSGASGAMGFDATTAGTEGDIFIDTFMTAGGAGVGNALIAFSDPAWIASVG